MKTQTGTAQPGPADSTFEFDAFISYCTSLIPDGPVGEELQRLLESFPVPRQLRQNIVRPKIFRNRLKIFRDTTDLSAGGNLDEAIRGRLRVSRWLIVVCSPNTAQSRYCCDELKYFREIRGDAQVLFLLIAGEPHQSIPVLANEMIRGGTSGDAKMKGSTTPLAADVRAADLPGIIAKLRGIKLPKQKQERFKILAPLLGCDSPDQLIQRHLAQARRQILQVSLLVMLIGCGIFLKIEEWRKRLNIERTIGIAQTRSVDPKVRYLLSDQMLRLSLSEDLQRRATTARLQASLDLGSTFLLEPCFYGKVAMPISDTEAKKVSRTIQGSSAAWNWINFEDADWMLDPTRRWTTVIGPLGPIVYDLCSHENDQAVSFYYFADCYDEIGSRGITRNSIAVTPAGNRLAAFHADSAHGNSLSIWEKPGFPAIVIAATGTDLNDSVAFIANGQMIVCGKHVWQIANGVEEVILLDNEPSAISADGRWLVRTKLARDEHSAPAPPSVDKDTVPATTTEAGHNEDRPAVYATCELWDTQAAFAKTVKQVQTADDYRRITETELRTRPLFAQDSPDERAARHGWNLNTVEAWDDANGVLETSLCLDRRRSPTHPPLKTLVPSNSEFGEDSPIEISPDGIWCASIDNSFRIWDLRGENPFVSPTLERRGLRGDRVRFSPDGRWVVAANSQEVGDGCIATVFSIKNAAADWPSVDVTFAGDNRSQHPLVDFSIDGRWLIYYSPMLGDQPVLLFWPLEPNRQISLNDLSADERREYFPNAHSTTSEKSSAQVMAESAARCIASAEEAFQQWRDRFQASPNAAVREANACIDLAIGKIEEAKRNNPTLAIDARQHAGRFAQICFLPAVRHLADTGSLEEANTLVHVIKSSIPKNIRMRLDDLPQRSWNFWIKQANDAAKHGDQQGVTEAIGRLKAQGIENINDIERKTKWNLADHRFTLLLETKPSPEGIAEAREFIKLLFEREATERNDSTGDSAYLATRAGEWLLNSDMIEPALEFYDIADETLRKSNNTLSNRILNRICWSGALAGKASLVVKYGKRAVRSEPKNVDFKDTLALALALSGSGSEAADLYEECDNAPSRPSNRSSRLLRHWIVTLRRGLNPFTSKVISGLKKPSGISNEDLIKWSDVKP